MIDLCESDKKWLAAAIDFEGSISLFRDKRGHCRRGFVWVPRLQIGATHEGAIEYCHTITGLGNVYSFSPKNKNWRRIYYWHVYSGGMRLLIPQVQPFLIIKKKHAELILEAMQILKSHWGNQYHVEINGDQRLSEIELAIKSMNIKGKRAS